MGFRRRLGAVALAAVVLALSGCTSAVMEGTKQLKDELLAFDIVESGYQSSKGMTLFDSDAYSSIELDIVEGASADDLAEVVRHWRLGVDGIDARWQLGLSMPTALDGYSDFRVAGAHPIDDLDAMVRFWQRAGSDLESASVSINDYSGVRGGSIHLRLPPQQSASFQDFVAGLRDEAVALPLTFRWIFDTVVPAGTLSVSSDNSFPNVHMLDMLEQLAQPTQRDPGSIWFSASQSEDYFQPGEPLRLNVSVHLQPPNIPEPGDDSDASWQKLGQRVLADPDTWSAIREIASRLPKGETEVTLGFYVWDDQVANLDPLVCSTSDVEDIYGPLNNEVWDAWVADGDPVACS